MSKLFVIVLVTTYWVYFIHSEVVKREVCKENEITVECAHCGPKTCEDLGHPVPCGGATSLCRPECVCIDGMVRDTNGTCIPKKDCCEKIFVPQTPKEEFRELGNLEGKILKNQVLPSDVIKGYCNED
ncbi:unnamed protein product [Spodoptera littoralis]|uniref:TIL domain-containing protein n=1 Tax=Spodoptera littoralis TaxID=7109 RepID=A0A9P0MZ76_SPOLI|nr:unnamed protein product [Spodoptera littoralis]CAH1635763.1 unnamed protein product [Spodoptera littoralis]